MGLRHPRHPDLRDGMVPVPDSEQPDRRRGFRYQLHHPVRHRRRHPDGLYLFRAQRPADRRGPPHHRDGVRRKDHLRDHPGLGEPPVPARSDSGGDRQYARPAERKADVHADGRPDGRHRHRDVHLQRRQYGRYGHHRPDLHEIPERVAGQGHPVPRLK